MNTPSSDDMREATRLTRTGRLVEATALLQRLLQSKASPVHPLSARAPAQGHAEVIEPTLKPATGAAESILAKALSRFLKPGTRSDVGPGLGDLRMRPATNPPTVLPAGAQFLSATFSSQAGSRAYKLYVPSGYTGQAVPLIVMLHGCTQSADDFAAGTRMNAAAEEQTFLVVYPEQPVAANPSKCWNWFNASDQQRDVGEPALIAGITREVMRQYRVDPSRVYIAGLSAGGAAAAIMGATYPDLYAAMGVHSGLACGAAKDLPSAFAAMRQGKDAGRKSGAAGRANGTRMVPTIVFHGDQDTTVNPRNGDAVIAQSTPSTPLLRSVEHGAVPGGHPYSRVRHTDRDGRCVLEQWVIHGAGHSWAGGSAAGSYTDQRGPDATREMLRFFFEQAPPSEAQPG